MLHCQLDHGRGQEPKSPRVALRSSLKARHVAVLYCTVLYCTVLYCTVRLVTLLQLAQWSSLSEVAVVGYMVLVRVDT